MASILEIETLLEAVALFRWTVFHFDVPHKY